jgi:cell pole-organizing protein PopZ
MDLRKIKKLIDLLEESNLAEIEIKEGEESVRLSRIPTGVAVAAPAAALEVRSPVAAAPAPKPAPAPRPHPAFSEDTLVGEPAATKAAGALGKLMGSMMVQSGVTLDDVVKEMLKPMLRDWLDANLPQLVETEVQKEIERIRRMAR